MIKEFIVKMRDDNENKINSLESEMSELVRDLSCAEQTLEKMIREKKSDTYIFSPRTMDLQIDEKIRAKQSDIRELKQKIEYVRHIMEERLKNREEYNQLLAELEMNCTEVCEQNRTCTKNGEKNQICTEDAEQDQTCTEKVEQDQTCSEDVKDKHADPEISEHGSKSEYFSETKDEAEKENTELIVLNKRQLLSFLQTIYKGSETCLALMNGNKNRSKNELRKLMKSIVEFKKMIEIDDV